MKTLSLYIFLVVCSLTAGCKFDEIKSVSTTGSMTIGVDENVEPLMRDEIKEFERLNPEAKVDMTVGPTTNTIVDFLNGDVKVIVTTRTFNDEEKAIIEKKNIEVKEYPLAIDGIGFITNKDNPVKRVTSDDLRKILSGEYKLWTDIKSQDEAQNEAAKKFFTGTKNNIKAFIQRKNSATNKYVQDSILREMQYSTAALVCSTSVQILESVRANENGIGILSMNWLSKGSQDTIDTTINTLRVSKIWESGRQDDFVEFHQGLIYDGSYPYRRTIYVFSRETGIQLSTGFITFLVKTDGQKVVLKNSLVPVTQPVRTIQIN